MVQTNKQTTGLIKDMEVVSVFQENQNTLSLTLQSTISQHLQHAA